MLFLPKLTAPSGKGNHARVFLRGVAVGEKKRINFKVQGLKRSLVKEPPHRCSRGIEKRGAIVCERTVVNADQRLKLPAMLMHGALDEAYTKIKKDKNLMNEVFDAALNQSPNVNPLGGLTRDVMFMLAGKNPRDFYRGREAVKSSEWDAGGMKRLWGSVKYLTHEYTPLPFVNQLFDLRDNPYWWWNVFGSITGMGAWFKPQLYGEAEQNKAVTAEKRRKKLNGKAAVFGGNGK